MFAPCAANLRSPARDDLPRRGRGPRAGGRQRRQGRPGPPRPRRQSSAAPSDPRARCRALRRPGSGAPPGAGPRPSRLRQRPDAPAPARSCASARPKLRPEHAGGRGGIDRAAAGDVVVGSGDDGADAEEAEQPHELARHEPALLHEVIRRGEQIDGPQVRVRRLVTDRHGTARQAREDRVERPTPVVVAEDLPRQHERPGIRREGAVKLVARLRPGGWDALPLELRVDRPPADERERGEDEQSDQHGGRARRRGDPQPRDPESTQRRQKPRRTETEQPSNSGRHERRGLVRRAHEAQNEDMAVRPGHAASQRRAVGESGHHDHDPDDHERQEQRRIAVPAGRHEAGDREGGQQEAERRPQGG